MTSITVLMDNIGERPYLAEHGLSFLVEIAHGPTILFDTGASAKFMSNARIAECDLNRIDCVVISHGHNDHSGGYPALISSGIRKPLWTGSGFFTKKYRIHDQEARNIGAPFTQELLKEHQIRWVEAEEPVCEMYPGVWLMSGFTALDDYVHVSDEFFVTDGSTWKPDTFHDEAVLVCAGSEGLLVIAGCCHPGVIPMLHTVHERFHVPIRAFMGGMHLGSTGKQELEKTLSEVCNLVTGEIGASHCTGKKAREYLAANRESYIDLHSGARITCG